MTHNVSESQSPNVSFERERGVYAIHVTRDVAHAVIEVGDDTLRTNRIQQIFRVLAEANVSIFLIKMHRTAVTLAFAGHEAARAEEALASAELRAKVRRNLALITVRASSMRELSGIMVAIADAIGAAGARLYETGDSHNSVLCLIDGEFTPKATHNLRHAFNLHATAVREETLSAGSAA